MNPDNNDKLSQLLREHFPKAPDGPKDEFSQIEQRIDTNRRFRIWTAVLAPTAAAALLLFTLLSQRPDPPVQTASLASFVEDSFAVIYDEVDYVPLPEGVEFSQ